MIVEKNFTGVAPENIPKDSEYVRCNFARSAVGGVAVRLFPGDDTPRTFRQCNLNGCEVPPGSTVDRCPQHILEMDVPDVEETITVDGVEVSRRPFTKRILYRDGVPFKEFREVLGE